MRCVFKVISFNFKSSRYNNIDLTSSETFHSKDLTIQKTIKLKQLPNFDAQTLGFGLNASDHMAEIDYESETGWGKPTIMPLQKIPIHPFNSSLHYAVQCFQGMKAYKNRDGVIRMFRPQCNMQRLKLSSKRIALPDFDGNQFLKIIEEFVRVQSRWIPAISQFSLYLRPLHISMENSLGVKSPKASKLMVLGSPVGPYYPSGFTPISLACSDQNIRSAPGGTGSFKVGGNYGPTLDLGNKANRRGHHQVLWLYGDKIIEVGASNIFFVFKAANNKTQIVTPELRDLILPGITRDSIMRLVQAKDDYIMTEREITITQVIQRNKKGELLECFSAGTAVIIGSVMNIEYNGEDHPIHIEEKLQAGQHTFSIRKELLDIQEGIKEDSFGWTKVIN